MSDFLAVFGREIDTGTISDRLTARPHLGKRHVVSRRFAWGTLFLKAPADRHCQPYVTATGEFYSAVGRPIITGPATNVAVGVLERVAKEWDEDATALWRKLSGVFVYSVAAMRPPSDC